MMLLYILTPMFIKLADKYTKRSLYVYIFVCMIVAMLIALLSGKTEIFDNNTYGYYSVLVQSGSYLLGMYVAEKKIVCGYTFKAFDMERYNSGVIFLSYSS